MPAQCWGPLIGANVISYRTAVIVGILCQAAGRLAFGPETHTVFSGLLDDWHVLQHYPPRVTLYVLMWIQFSPVVWHALSIWRRKLLPGSIAISMLPQWRHTPGQYCTRRHAHHMLVESTNSIMSQLLLHPTGCCAVRIQHNST